MTSLLALPRTSGPVRGPGPGPLGMAAGMPPSSVTGWPFPPPAPGPGGVLVPSPCFPRGGHPMSAPGRPDAVRQLQDRTHAGDVARRPRPRGETVGRCRRSSRLAPGRAPPTRGCSSAGTTPTIRSGTGASRRARAPRCRRAGPTRGRTGIGYIRRILAPEFKEPSDEWVRSWRPVRSRVNPIRRRSRTSSPRLCQRLPANS